MEMGAQTVEMMLQSNGSGFCLMRPSFYGVGVR